MGDLDTLGLLSGFAGILDETFRLGPEADKANKEQFGEAEDRFTELGNLINGEGRTGEERRVCT